MRFQVDVEKVVTNCDFKLEETMEIVVRHEVIEGKIYMIRGHKVMLDSDLAELYGVETFNLNKAVKRNISRFPQDFMFSAYKGRG